MKPNFALILSMDGIALLQRASKGWALVGDAYPDSPDLASEMAALRAKADTLAPEGATFKVVIPNDQIRYISMPAGSPNPTERRRAVETALDGATPYSLDELVIDHSVSGDQVLIAAVAMDTIQEADEFARGFGFDPLSFVAMPETRDFAGEPFFGTAHDIPDDIVVTPDDAAIRVTGRVSADAPPEQAEPEDSPTTESTEDAGSADVAVSFSTRRQRSDAPDAPQPDPSVRAADDTPRITFTEPASPKAPVVVPPRDIAPEELSQTFDIPNEDTVDSGQTSRRSGAQASGAGFVSKILAVVAERRAARKKVRADARAEAARKAEEAAALAAIPELPQNASGIENPTPPEEVAKPDPQAKTKKADKTARKGKKGKATKTAPPLVAQDAEPAEVPVAEPGPTPTLAKRLSASTGSLSADERRAEEERLTVFGARNGSYDEGTKRTGTMAVAALIAVLVIGTAAWALLFRDASLSPLTGTEPAADEIVAAAPPETIEETVPPGPSDEPAEDLAVDEDAATAAEETPTEATDDDAASPLIVTEAATADVPEDTAPPTSAETEARYAASGIWQASPDGLNAEDQAGGDAGTQSMSDTDTPPERGPEVDLATLEPDAAPGEPAPPPIYGKRYNMDDRGLVVATPDGAETPSGVLAFAGDPPVVPPARPGDPEPEAEDPAEADPASDARLEDTETPVAQETSVTRVAVKRPLVRPEVEIAEAEPVADTPANDVVLASAASLAGAAAAEASASQPLLDAEDRASIAAGLASGAEAVENNGAEAAADVIEPDFVALRPLRRPGNIDELAAIARQTQEPPPAAAPSGPTSVSVARQATLRSAINLRDVNLIGVYGQPSDRRALVRLSNGRYRKVKVGDRMDGGRVLAIGDDTLRYQKNGRNVTLNMPSG